MRAIKRGDLDRTPQPAAPLDILAQQIVAACVAAGEEGWPEDALFESFRRAWPYRDLKREDFDAVIEMHLNGRRGLLHRDGVGGRIMARKRARITAITGGGAIPDVADYQVRQQPDDTFVGTLNEDFAVEANVGDIFQLGNTSWRILKVERGVVRVADAQGQPPSIPFWLGEGAVADGRIVGRDRRPARGVRRSQRCCSDDLGLAPEAAMQIAEFLAEGRRVLGTVPTQKRVVLERFFDESGGMQMVLHAPFGGRINRAWGLALRKRFCRGFGFELQAAANEEAIVISLGLKHSFPLDDVFDYLQSEQRAQSADAGGARSADVRIALALERDALADARAFSAWQSRAAADPANARRRSAGRELSRGGRLPGKPAAGRSGNPDGSSAGPSDHRRLPERGHRHRRFDRSAERTARRNRSSAWRSTRPSLRRSRAGF